MMKVYILKLALLIALAVIFKSARGETETLKESTGAVALKRRTLFTKRHALEVAAKQHIMGDSTALLETDLNGGRMQVEGKGKKSKGGSKKSKKSKGGSKKSKKFGRFIL